MGKKIEIFIQLAFELGQAYQRVYDKAGLDNIVDFNDIAYANSCGGQWKFKGDMSNLPELFKIHELNSDRINALNEMAKDLQNIKKIAKQQMKYMVKEQSMEEDMKNIKKLKSLLVGEAKKDYEQSIENVLTRLKDYEQIEKEHQKENGELRKKVKELEEQKEQNEHYKELINALEDYYNITEEDIENSVKADK